MATHLATPGQEAAAQRLLQLGISLFLLGLLTGLAVPSLANPRMALASHIEGLMNGTFLLVLGLLWPKLRLSELKLKAAFGLAVYGTFANWLASLLAAIWPAGSRLMPMAAQGRAGTALQEMVVDTLLVSLSIAMIAACGLVLVGLMAPRATRDR